MLGPRRAPRIALLAALTSLVAHTGCGRGGAPGPTPPSGLSYDLNPAAYVKDAPVTANSPHLASGTATGYAVSPPLPPGLVLDQLTGIVSGTPTNLTSQAPYTVTATGPGGATSAVLTITVTEAPPTGLAYPEPNPTYIKGIPIADNVPTCGGGLVVAYGITPALPAGLSFDAASGRISGRPSAWAAPTAYTVTASNSGGSTTAQVVIAVELPTPRHLFVADDKSAAILVFAMDPAAGVLTALAPLTGVTNPSVGAHPGGSLVFVSGRFGASNLLRSYWADHSTGALTLASSVQTGFAPSVAAIDPLGRFAFVRDSTPQLLPVAVDGAVGTLTTRAGLPTAGSHSYMASAVDASGRYLYESSFDGTLAQFAIAPDGQLIGAGASAVGTSGGVAAHPVRPLIYGTSPGPVSGFVGAAAVRTFGLDVATGALELAASASAIGTNPLLLAVDPLGRFAFVSDMGAREVLPFAIDDVTGALAPVGAGWSTGPAPFGVAVDPSGRFLVVACYGGSYVWGSLHVFRIEASGDLTRVQILGGESSSTPIGSAAVPAPSSLAFTFGAAPP